MKILRKAERKDDLYEVVKKVAKNRGISISQIEKEAGLARSSICKWKKNSPSIANLKKVADVLGMSTSELIHNAEQEEEKQCQK